MMPYISDHSQSGLADQGIRESLIAIANHRHGARTAGFGYGSLRQCPVGTDWQGSDAIVFFIGDEINGPCGV